MSTTPPSGGVPAPSPALAEVLADWAKRTPAVDAPTAELAAWFHLKVELLQPIIHNPDHPEHDQAEEFARRASVAAKSLQDKEGDQ